MKNLLNHLEHRNICVTKGLYSFFNAAIQKKAANSRFHKQGVKKKTNVRFLSDIRFDPCLFSFRG